MNKRQWAHHKAWLRARNKPQHYFLGIVILAGVATTIAVLSCQLTGQDIRTEFAFAQSILDYGWYPWNLSPINSAVLVNYSLAKLAAFDNMSFPVAYRQLSFFALLPVIPLFYLTWKNIIGMRAAFWSSVLFMAPVFIAVPGQGLRLSFGLLLATVIIFILNYRMARRTKLILLGICYVLLVLSYYAFAIILGIIIAGILAGRMLAKGLRHKLSTRALIVSLVVCTLLTVGWLQYSCQAFYSSGSNTVPDLTVEALSMVQPHSGAAYSSMARTFLGVDFLQADIIGKIARVLQYAVQALAFMGLLYWWRHKKGLLLSSEMAFGAIASIALLLIMTLVPYWSSHYEVERILQFGLLFIAPFAIYGIKMVRRQHVYLIACILFPAYALANYFGIYAGMFLWVTN